MYDLRHDGKMCGDWRFHVSEISHSPTRSLENAEININFKPMTDFYLLAILDL